MHYLKSGGRSGLREPLPRLVSRLLTFLRFFFDASAKVPALDTLFHSPAYTAAVSTVCRDKPVLDAFQVGIILQLPGQAVPMHYDVPWFWGASRFTLPQWLLVVMDHSGLWRDRRVSQLQGVAYLHDWEGWE